MFVLERLVYASSLCSFALFVQYIYFPVVPTVCSSEVCTLPDDSLHRLTAMYLLFDLVYYIHKWTDSSSAQPTTIAMRCLSYIYLMVHFSFAFVLLWLCCALV